MEHATSTHIDDIICHGPTLMVNDVKGNPAATFQINLSGATDQIQEVKVLEHPELGRCYEFTVHTNDLTTKRAVSINVHSLYRDQAVSGNLIGPDQNLRSEWTRSRNLKDRPHISTRVTSGDNNMFHLNGCYDHRSDTTQQILVEPSHNLSGYTVADFKNSQRTSLCFLGVGRSQIRTPTINQRDIDVIKQSVSNLTRELEHPDTLEFHSQLDKAQCEFQAEHDHELASMENAFTRVRASSYHTSSHPQEFSYDWYKPVHRGFSGPAAHQTKGLVSMGATKGLSGLFSMGDTVETRCRTVCHRSDFFDWFQICFHFVNVESPKAVVFKSTLESCRATANKHQQNGILIKEEHMALSVKAEQLKREINRIKFKKAQEHCRKLQIEQITRIRDLTTKMLVKLEPETAIPASGGGACTGAGNKETLGDFVVKQIHH